MFETNVIELWEQEQDVDQPATQDAGQDAELESWAGVSSASSALDALTLAQHSRAQGLCCTFRTFAQTCRNFYKRFKCCRAVPSCPTSAIERSKVVGGSSSCMCPGLWFDPLNIHFLLMGLLGLVIFISSACPGGILQNYIANVGSHASLYASGHTPNVTTDTKLKPASMHST